MEKNINIIDRFLKGESAESEESGETELFRWFESEEAKKEIFASYDERWLESSEELSAEIRNKMLVRIKKESNQGEKAQLARASKQRLRINILYRYIAVACLFLLIGTGLSITIEKLFLTTDFIVLAEDGQKSTVELPDGTIAWLNSGSRLIYKNTYGWWNRTVSLDGEGYFEVKKNNGKDFIVQVNDIKVTALGTKFNIRAYSNTEEITTTLLEGKVNVQSQTKEILLSSGQQLSFNKQSDSFSEVRNCDAKQYALWKSNKLYFGYESLEEIGKTLERLYSIKVVFTSEAAGKYTFSGTISNTNLINVLECICLTAPVKYEIKSNILYFSEVNQ